MEDKPLNSRLQAQLDQQERLRKDREAAKSLYLPPEVQMVLDDIMKFIETQSQGCKDLAAMTDSKFISDRSLHMLLMADIIKQYITNQRKNSAS